MENKFPKLSVIYKQVPMEVASTDEEQDQEKEQNEENEELENKTTTEEKKTTELENKENEYVVTRSGRKSFLPKPFVQVKSSSSSSRPKKKPRKEAKKKKKTNAEVKDSVGELLHFANSQAFVQNNSYEKWMKEIVVNEYGAELEEEKDVELAMEQFILAANVIFKGLHM